MDAVGSGDWPAQLHIAVLGPLALTRNGEPLRTPPAGERTVLALLALAQSAPLRVESIVDALWGEAPPASSVGIVHTYISRIRRILDENGSRIRVRRDGAGYALLASEDELDLKLFRRLMDQARAESACAGPGARAVFERALSLWRGAPLADIAVLRGHPAVIALQDEIAGAVFSYADAAAEGGYDEDVLPYLRALVAQSPLDEAAYARLMLAMAAIGRQGEALAAYEELRCRLDSELGVLPGQAVRDAHAQVLRQESRPVARSPGSPFQLPAAIADFVGRSAESARLIEVLKTSHAEVGVPVAAVSGPPGAGKTSLVLQVAHRLRADFPDGQLWAHGAGTSSSPPGSDEVLGEFLRALGVTGSAIPSASAERAALYRSRLAGRRVLVVIDDAASVDQVRPLIPGTVGCAVLITSRFQLTGLDGAHIVPLEALTTADATSMLSRIAGRSRIDSQREAAELLVQVCGALPLALRIVGSKLAARPSWPLDLMAKRLLDASTRVRELEAGGMSVWATIESSYQLLSERAALAFRLLALLGRGDFAAWVVGVLLDADDASSVVRELEDRSLLTAVGADATGEARYRLHDLLRDFAGQRLDADPPGLCEQALGRLLGAWLQLVTAAGDRLPTDRNFLAPPPHQVDTRLPPRVVHQLVADPVAWFTAERGNVRNAVEAACGIGRLDVARQLIAHQSTFFSHQCRYEDAERLWSRLREHAERLADPAHAVLARLHVATAKVLHGHPADALALLNVCVRELEELGNLLLVSSALEWRATCYHDLDMYQQAATDAERALAAARRSGSRDAEHRCLVTLANGLTYLGEVARAVEVGEEALALALDLNAPTFEFASKILLAQAYCQAGSFDKGIATGRGALALSRTLGDLGGEGLALGVLGDVYRQAGLVPEAVETLQLALPIFRDRASPRYYAVCLHKLGLACAAMGSGDTIGYLEESARVFRELGVLHRAERVRRDLDRCRGAAGREAVTIDSSVA